MPGDDGPMNNERIWKIREVSKKLCGKVNRDYATTADLMREVMTLEDYEPFPVDEHLVADYPLPLPTPLTRFSSSSSTSANCDGVSDGLNTPTLHESAASPSLPLTPGEARSDGIEECVSDFRGRYLIASRDLVPGETLLVERGFATVIADKQTKVFCEACQAYPEPSTTYSKCPSCKTVVWCSNSCRERSMQDFHRYECSTKSQLSPLKTDHFYLAMRMLIRGWDNALHKYIRGISVGEALGMADEFSLMENKTKMSFEKTIEAAVMCKVYLWILKSTGFVERLQNQIEQKEAQENEYSAQYISLDHFLATTILAHWIRIQCNAFQHNFLQVIKHNPNHYRKLPEIEPYKPIGFGVQVSLKIAQINHSCRPNCDYYFLGDLHIIRTIDHIKKGQEIFITYERIARSMVEKEDRSPHVAKNYGFACFCPYCNTPGLDFCELYAMENEASAEDKAEVELRMDEAAEHMRHNHVEEALQLLFQLKQSCIMKSMFWTASEIDERIDDCFGLLGTIIVVTF